VIPRAPDVTQCASGARRNADAFTRAIAQRAIIRLLEPERIET
jgi:hypothetical protein